MDNIKLLAILAIGVCILVVVITVIVIKKRKKKKLKKLIEDLEYQKNQLDSSPVGAELNKAESYVKNDKLEMSYKNWQTRLQKIKETQIPKITDMIIDAEYSLSKTDYKSTMNKIAKLEMEIYKVRTDSEFLLDEIKNLTTSEERSRAVITKLKSRYREVYNKFNESKNDYGKFTEAVELQFENIAKKFEDFENIMDKNEYDEVTNIISAVTKMLDHMDNVVEQLPNIVLIAEGILPKKMNEIKEIYDKMVKEGYPLDYLNVEFNIEEANKKIKEITDKLTVLDLDDSLFDLKVLTEYFESLFIDFEKEKIIKNEYEQINKILQNKLEKTNELVNDIFSQMNDLKKAFNLEEKDIKDLEAIKKDLNNLNNDYKTLISHTANHTFAYSKLTEEVEMLVVKLNTIEERLDKSLNILGSMHDDEQRARQQLEEVKILLKDAKSQIRTYNMPIIPNTYYVELREASDAIKEIIKELSKKPVTIDVLNTRVDTARDLVLKLYGKTKEMIKMANLSENAIVYGNRYRIVEEEIDKALSYSEKLFNKGEYKKSLELTVNSLNKIEPGIYDKLLRLFEKQN